MIEVQNLSFSYPGASSKVFDGFQLKLESGHTYGLLGRVFKIRLKSDAFFP